MSIQPVLDELPFRPPHYRCGDGSKPIADSHPDGVSCANCQLIRDPEKTARMMTLTEMEYQILQFVYWNPDCETTDFESDKLLLKAGIGRQMTAAGSLVRKGLLTVRLDGRDLHHWSPTDQAADYLDLD